MFSLVWFHMVVYLTARVDLLPTPEEPFASLAGKRPPPTAGGTGEWHILTKIFDFAAVAGSDLPHVYKGPFPPQNFVLTAW